MEKNKLFYSWWDKNETLSRDLFETKYPLLFKSRDHFGNIYIDDIWWKPLLWIFINWAFILNIFFERDELDFFEKRIIFEKLISRSNLKDILKNANNDVNMKIVNIINKKQKKINLYLKNKKC